MTAFLKAIHPKVRWAAYAGTVMSGLLSVLGAMGVHLPVEAVSLLVTLAAATAGWARAQQ